MILLLIVSVIISILIHRKETNCYYEDIYKDDNHKYPPKSSLILASLLTIVSIGIFLFAKKTPIMAMIPIAVFIAVLSVWVLEQINIRQIRAVCALSLVPAALSAISKMILDDKTHAVSIGSIILSGVLPIIICCLVGAIRYLFIEGYLMKQYSEDELCVELGNTDYGTIKYKQLMALLARRGKKAAKKRGSELRRKRFKTGYAPEEPLDPEETDEYEDVYSDSSLEPPISSNNNNKFYYVVFGVAVLIVIVCLVIVLMNI